MQPFDLLTDEDKETIYQYVAAYSHCEPESVDAILQMWNKNKKRLLKAFGGKLRISVPISCEATPQELMHQLEQLYKVPSIYALWFEYDEIVEREKKEGSVYIHPFIEDLFHWLYKMGRQARKIPREDVGHLIDYLRYDSVMTQKTYYAESFYYDEKDKVLSIPLGTKIMRAVRKVLEYYDYPNMYLFNKWRDDVSVILTLKKVETEITFSIHPIDFMTMSDNNCNWQSCMNWRYDGSYSTGTIEMMNSNVAIVAYIESNRFNFTFNGHKIPNKSWRTLIFAHKDILLVGKHYPYNNNDFSISCLRALQPVLEKNLGWKYQYKEQKYYDIIKYYKNDYLKETLNLRLNSKYFHKIFVYMGGVMYHDIIEDRYIEYFCCRNYVKKSLFLNLCGPATCMCCGETILPDDDGEMSTSDKFCAECADKHRCSRCGHVSRDKNDKKYIVKVWTPTSFTRYEKRGYIRERIICEHCLFNEYIFYPKDKLFISKAAISTYKINKERLRPVNNEVIKQNAVRCAIHE